MKHLEDTNILVTGGTGSFGQAFTRAVLTQTDRARVSIYSRDEFKQSEMQKEFADVDDGERLRFFLGDVRDLSRLSMAMVDHQIVISAAALKQVPALEYNPFEAVETNIIGAAQNVIRAALTNGVKKVMYLSSDKAVAPINAYGVSKAMGERLMVAANAYAGRRRTKFSAVRYGNVAGSRGSVIPIWRELIERGISLSVTDPNATRFWMTITQAVEFVASSLEQMVGGEVFIPLLSSFRIAELANVMAGDNWQIIGLRPGEKLHEMLITPDEASMAWHTPRGYVIARPPSALVRSCQPPDGELVEVHYMYSSAFDTDRLKGDALREALRNVR